MCRNILTKLMDNKSSLLFHQPVDPLVYGIPDYFDIIRDPMDLGTVKKKLTNRKYTNIDEFAADVRLTFSNAMTYNPPGNPVHTVAKELNEIFESEWELVERQCRDRNLVNQQQAMKVIKVRAAVDSKSAIAKGLVSRSNSKPLIDRGPVPCSNPVAKKTLTDMMSSKVKIKFSVRSLEQTSSKADDSREGSFNHSVPAVNESLSRSLPSIKENAKISKLQAPEHRSKIIGNELRSCNDTSTSPLGSSGQGEESYLQDEPLSPNRALRAAMLRSQKARIEAQVKAAEAAAQLKLDEEMRMKREQERKAARLALHMMKKTVDIDNSDFLKELENFSKTWQSSPPGKLIVDFVDGIDLPPGLGSPLERLGLFMKKDFEEDVEHEMEDVEHESGDSVSPSTDVDMEEGEINCCR
ncbi:hypothetical protein PR202_ga25088 [Eleusine coracana subsp. coracana]|uniref:Bromo domain-containing protein n=1 Tax=Eleusine coracana subsp. coracana TaxID=191504 RepID=A0AAV5D9B0_ELECO|nr:hypothetical protein PR202_ga25088 [Eleusine coracana subsp. coracana]